MPAFIHCIFCLIQTVLRQREFQLFCSKKILDTAIVASFISHLRRLSVIFSLIDDLHIWEEMPLKYTNLLLKLIKMKEVDIKQMHSDILLK